MKGWLTIALPLYLLDQATKFLVLRHIATDEVIPVIPGFFNLVQVHNTGAAFGMMKDNNLFFILLASAAMIVLAVMSWKGAFKDRLSWLGSVLLVSGVAGNLTDRLVHGYVVDFLDVILPWYGHWPAFNVADACICVAAGLFVLASILEGRRPAAKE
ncbi:MAG TPA: signal peptidase II [Terrimicrobiaceae bacterium]|nr:signal peptidase II [Terrimicrobiaceae bacterium]